MSAFSQFALAKKGEGIGKGGERKGRQLLLHILSLSLLFLFECVEKSFFLQGTSCQ